jgi:hypothetical protein
MLLEGSSEAAFSYSLSFKPPPLPHHPQQKIDWRCCDYYTPFLCSELDSACDELTGQFDCRELIWKVRFQRPKAETHIFLLSWWNTSLAPVLCCFVPTTDLLCADLRVSFWTLLKYSPSLPCNFWSRRWQNLTDLNSSSIHLELARHGPP